MPEFLQEQCTADNITPEVSRLLDAAAERECRRRDMAEAMVKLGHGGPSPGDRAAQVVLDLSGERKQP